MLATKAPSGDSGKAKAKQPAPVTLVHFKDKYTALSLAYAQVKAWEKGVMDITGDDVDDAESFDGRMEKVVEMPEDFPTPTNSTACKFATFMLRLFNECEGGSVGGNACRLHSVFAAAVEDLEELMPKELFEHLLGLTAAILSHGLQSWILRGDRHGGQQLFNFLAKEWKRFFAMDHEKLVFSGGTTESLEYGREVCTALQKYLKSFGHKSWAGTGATAYKFNFVTIQRRKKRAPDGEPGAAAPSAPKKAKQPAVGGSADAAGAADAVALNAWLDTADDTVGKSVAMQLRLSTEKGHLDTHIVVSGATSVWKLNQYATHARGLELPGNPEPHCQKGRCHPKAVIRVTRSGCCTNTMIANNRSAAAVAGKGAAFVDEKQVKVCTLFRGVSTGKALVQTAIDASMKVELVHPGLGDWGPLHIELVGVAPRKLTMEIGDRMHNYQMLPRVVAFDDVDKALTLEQLADARNRAWHGDKVCPRASKVQYVWSKGAPPPVYNWADHWENLRDPLFTDAGEDNLLWGIASDDDEYYLDFA